MASLEADDRIECGMIDFAALFQGCVFIRVYCISTLQSGVDLFLRKGERVFWFVQVVLSSGGFFSSSRETLHSEIMICTRLGIIVQTS